MTSISRKPPKQQDELLKGIFEENFSDFLRFMYSSADDIFDLERGIQFMDKELLAIVPNRERKKGKRIADLLAKVFLKDGTEKWLLVHTEIEAGSQKDFPFRLFQYHYRLLDRYQVPVETIAVFSGGENQSRPHEYFHRGIDTNMGVIEIIKKHAREDGVEQNRRMVIRNLISKLELSDEQAAEVAEVSVNVVRDVRKELEKEKHG